MGKYSYCFLLGFNIRILVPPPFSYLFLIFFYFFWWLYSSFLKRTGPFCQDNVRMLLDVASELPDNEPLVQKHFFALLSSVWRVTSRNGCRHSNSTSQAGVYPAGRFLPSGENHTFKNSTTETSVKMNFTNLSLSRKLVAAALYDADATPRHDRNSVFNSVDEDSAGADLLGITLELPGEGDLSTIPFPSIISMSICGPDPQPSTDKSTGSSNNLRSSLRTAENRFRYELMQSYFTCFQRYSRSLVFVLD